MGIRMSELMPNKFQPTIYFMEVITREKHRILCQIAAYGLPVNVLNELRR